MTVRSPFVGTTLPDLKRVLDLDVMRQRVYASNLANASTPGYRRQDVRFAQTLETSQRRLALRATNPAHAGALIQESTTPLEVFEASEAGDTGVSLDEEMVELAKNQMHFQLAARLAALRLAGLRASIHGRR